MNEQPHDQAERIDRLQGECLQVIARPDKVCTLYGVEPQDVAFAVLEVIGQYRDDFAAVKDNSYQALNHAIRHFPGALDQELRKRKTNAENKDGARARKTG
jgi:hypothetical protein